MDDHAPDAPNITQGRYGCAPFSHRVKEVREASMVNGIREARNKTSCSDNAPLDADDEWIYATSNRSIDVYQHNYPNNQSRSSLPPEDPMPCRASLAV